MKTKVQVTACLRRSYSLWHSDLLDDLHGQGSLLVWGSLGISVTRQWMYLCGNATVAWELPVWLDPWLLTSPLSCKNQGSLTNSCTVPFIYDIAAKGFLGADTKLPAVIREPRGPTKKQSAPVYHRIRLWPPSRRRTSQNSNGSMVVREPWFPLLGTSQAASAFRLSQEQRRGRPHFKLPQALTSLQLDVTSLPCVSPLSPEFLSINAVPRSLSELAFKRIILRFRFQERLRTHLKEVSKLFL